MIAREVVEPEKPAWVDIVRKFGPGILSQDGSIDRRRLGEIVFGDESKRRLLMDITHPRIKEAVREQARGIQEGECARRRSGSGAYSRKRRAQGIPRRAYSRDGRRGVADREAREESGIRARRRSRE